VRVKRAILVLSVMTSGRGHHIYAVDRAITSLKLVQLSDYCGFLMRNRLALSIKVFSSGTVSLRSNYIASVGQKLFIQPKHLPTLSPSAASVPVTLVPNM
jgi:hypothetical protein